MEFALGDASSMWCADMPHDQPRQIYDQSPRRTAKPKRPASSLGLGGGIEGFTSQPLTTTQAPKSTECLNLTTTLQNEGKMYIFVIYTLRLVTKQILRVFWRLWKNCVLCLGG